MEAKTCLHCKTPLKGRVDKKFCDDYCRNSYNNELNRDKNKFVRNINHALRKNRQILEELLKKDCIKKINKKELLYQGFQAKYHTHTSIGQNGEIIYCTYDFAVSTLESDWVIVKKEN